MSSFQFMLYKLSSYFIRWIDNSLHKYFQLICHNLVSPNMPNINWKIVLVRNSLKVYFFVFAGISFIPWISSFICKEQNNFKRTILNWTRDFFYLYPLCLNYSLLFTKTNMINHYGYLLLSVDLKIVYKFDWSCKCYSFRFTKTGLI